MHHDSVRVGVKAAVVVVIVGNIKLSKCSTRGSKQARELFHLIFRMLLDKNLMLIDRILVASRVMFASGRERNDLLACGYCSTAQQKNERSLSHKHSSIILFHGFANLSNTVP